MRVVRRAAYGPSCSGSVTRRLNVQFLPSARSTMRTRVPMSRHASRPFNVLGNNTSLTLTRVITKRNSASLYQRNRCTYKMRMDKGRLSTIPIKNGMFTANGLVRHNESSRV